MLHAIRAFANRRLESFRSSQFGPGAEFAFAQAPWDRVQPRLASFGPLSRASVRRGSLEQPRPVGAVCRGLQVWAAPARSYVGTARCVRSYCALELVADFGSRDGWTA